MSLAHRVKAMHHPDLAHIIEHQRRLRAMLSAEHPAVAEVADYLDSLDHSSRLAATRSLGRKHQARLYDAVDGFRPVTIDDIVPSECGVRTPVHHYGKNTLPAFTIFQKRFLRPETGADELWGYNHQTMSPITGPGYFIAYNASDRPEVDIDYTAVPPERPFGWPKVQLNTAGLSNMVYAHMIDKLRGVTEHVSIGRAWKKGRVQPAWFVLVRE